MNGIVWCLIWESAHSALLNTPVYRVISSNFSHRYAAIGSSRLPLGRGVQNQTMLRFEKDAAFNYAELYPRRHRAYTRFVTRHRALRSKNLCYGKLTVYSTRTAAKIFSWGVVKIAPVRCIIGPDGAWF